MNAIETLRKAMLSHIGANKHFAADWKKRKALLRRTLRTRPVSPVHVVSLGDTLRDIFRDVSKPGRSQSDLSSGGGTWAHLVCVYLNMCLAGTDAVAVTKSLVPKCIKNALTVAHSSATVSSDLDVVVCYLPRLHSLETTSERNALRDIDDEIGERLRELTLVVVQTKTNWNDGIQTPMLWNLLYKLAYSKSIPVESGLTVGKSVYTISQIGEFLYAFVTVPSNKLESFRSHHATVQRAMTMTGGYYWGAPTQNGICNNVKELLPHVYRRTKGHFAAPEELGVAFASALNGRDVSFDYAAFDFE